MWFIVLTAGIGVVGLLDRRRRMNAVEVLHGMGGWGALLGGIFLLGGLSSLRALDPWTGALELALVASILLLMLHVVVDVTRQSRVVLAVVAGAAAISATWYAADLLTLPGIDLKGTALHLRGSSGGFVSSRFLNQYQTAVLPLTTPLLLDRRLATWIRAVIGVVLVATWWMLFMTEPRGAVVALAVGAAVIAWLSPAGRRVAGSMALGAGAGAALTALFRALRGSPGLVRGDVFTSTSGRLAAWQDAIGAIRDNPLLGVGPGHLAHVEIATQSSTRLANPHNSLLQFGAEWGALVGVGVAAAAAVTFLRMMRHLRRSGMGNPGEFLQAGVVGAATSLAVLSLVSGVVVTPVAQVLLGLTVGVTLGLVRSPTPQSLAGRRAWLAVPLVLASLAPMVLVVEATVSSAGREWHQTTYIERGGGILHPRFWNQGYRGEHDQRPEPVHET